MGIFNNFLRNLLKVFFILLYNPLAWTYDFVAEIVSLGRWNEWVLLAAPYLLESPILELGHGPGYLQVVLSNKGKIVYGIDASQQMVRITKKRLSDGGYSVRLIQGNSQHLPYSSNFFRYAVATFPSEYIMEPETLSEIWRVLDKEGELIIVAAAWITGESFLDRMAAWLFRVTGQAPQEAVSEIQQWYTQEFEGDQKPKYRFETQVIKLETSEVLLIRAKKVLP